MLNYLKNNKKKYKCIINAIYLKLLIMGLKSIIHIIQLQLLVNFQNFFVHYIQKHFALVLTSNILKEINILIFIMNNQLSHVKIILKI